MYYLTKYPTGNIYIDQVLDESLLLIQTICRVKIVSERSSWDIGDKHRLDHSIKILYKAEILEELLPEATMLAL